MNLRVIIFIIAVLGLNAATVSADKDSEEARAQFEQGIELFENGKYGQAAIAFERAYQLKPSYKILWNIAQVENELGHYAAALQAYTNYLVEGGDGITQERREKIQHEMTRLNKLVGMIYIETEIKGADIFVDDRRQGTTPNVGTIFVDLGEHEVLLKMGGDPVHKELVKVAGGQRVTVKVNISQTGDPSSPVSPTDPDPEPQPEEPDGPKRVWTWVAFAVGGAAGIGAGVTGALTLKKSKSATEDCSGESCPPSSKSDVDSAKTLGYVTDALIGVAAAGVAAGIILFFVEPKTGDENNDDGMPVALIPAASSDGVGMFVTGRF